MKSYAHQSLTLKKVKKLAAECSDQDVQATLPTSEDRCFLFDAGGRGAVVGFWSNNGPMMLMDDDSVRAYAQQEYLRRKGRPLFTSDDELKEFATRAGWLRSTPERS